MLTVKTNTGREIVADLVIRGDQYAVLHIYTHSITPIEAYKIFGDPEETSVLYVYEEGKDTRIYRDFTEVYSVQKGGLITGPGEILIWLQHPEEYNDEEVISNAEQSEPDDNN